MDERERMLAEGPREAPEPPTAEAISTGARPRPAPAPKAPDDPGRGRSWSGSSSWYRLVPFALVLGLMGTRALGLEGAGRFLVVGAAAAAGLVVYLRRRNR